MKKKKGKRRPPRMKKAVRAAIADMGEVRALAARHALRIVVRHVECGRRKATKHWMFVAAKDGARVLDWWPGTGRWWSPATGEKGHAEDCFSALKVAGEIYRLRESPTIGDVLEEAFPASEWAFRDFTFGEGI